MQSSRYTPKSDYTTKSDISAILGPIPDPGDPHIPPKYVPPRWPDPSKPHKPEIDPFQFPLLPEERPKDPQKKPLRYDISRIICYQ